VKNILVIKLRYVGDVLLATPVLRALRERFPESRLSMLVNRGTEDILKWNPDLDRIPVVERASLAEQVRFVKELRQSGFDCVIDLTDGDRSAILTRLSRSPVRIGFNEEHRWRGLMYTSIVKTSSAVHRMERDLEALRPLDVEPKAGPLVLHTSPRDDEEADNLLREVGVGESDRPLIMFQSGARYWFKAWPAERFAELADRLTEAYNCRILVGGSAAEQGIAEAIKRRSRSSSISLAGRTTLLQYAAVLKRCTLFVGNDNGPMHMAVALGLPVVALFGPSDPSIWGPRGGQTEVLYKGLDCRRCFHPDCDRGDLNCMKQISVDEVFDAAQRLWA